MQKAQEKHILYFPGYWEVAEYSFLHLALNKTENTGSAKSMSRVVDRNGLCSRLAFSHCITFLRCIFWFQYFNIDFRVLSSGFLFFSCFFMSCLNVCIWMYVYEQIEAFLRSLVLSVPAQTWRQSVRGAFAHTAPAGNSSISPRSSKTVRKSSTWYQYVLLLNMNNRTT